jgi:LmbE family N-acetylglucosaminyl deacetylase
MSAPRSEPVIAGSQPGTLAVADLGPTLVVAPHPDDEVLGCGGAIALLRRAGVPVCTIVASDGAASHPGSRRYPPAALARLRRAESVAGLALLGVAEACVAFLGLPDGAVPTADGPDGGRAVDLARRALPNGSRARTVLLPWRREPHPDHRATWSIFSAALDASGMAARRLEYPIWALVRAEADALPRPGEARAWRLDVREVASLKRRAILAHRSQTTDLIDDAEIGHCLTADVLDHFARPDELFFEVRP